MSQGGSSGGGPAPSVRAVSGSRAAPAAPAVPGSLSLPDGAPAAILEELDGTPIGGHPMSGPGTGWARAMGAATALAGGRPALWVYALVAFLARGGMLVMLAPIVALPTFVGIANIVGPTSVTASGPTPRLVAIAVTSIAALVVAVVVGTLVGAAAETGLYRATVAGDPDDPGSGLLPAGAVVDGPTRRTVLRVAVVRLALLAPVLLVLGASVPHYVGVAYQELLLPIDLSLPLPVRVLLGAPAESVVLFVTWLTCEVVGGFAARRVVLSASGAPRAIGEALLDVARAPLTTLLTLILGLVGSAIVLAFGLLMAGLAWERARVTLVDGREPEQVLVTTLLLVGAWGVALLFAGVTAAWRSTLLTAELTRRRRPLPGLAAPGGAPGSGAKPPLGRLGPLEFAARAGRVTAPQLPRRSCQPVRVTPAGGRTSDGVRCALAALVHSDNPTAACAGRAAKEPVDG